MLTQSKEVCVLIADIVVASSKAREDGRLTLGDVRYFTPVLSSVLPGIKGISQVPKEIIESSENIDELVKYTKDRLAEQLDLNSDVLLQAAYQIVTIVGNLILLSSELKKI